MQLFDVFKWYLVIQIFCIIGFILGFKLFSPLKYHGFSISKPFGILIFSIAVWFICNKNLAIVSYSTLTLYILLTITGIGTWFYFKHIKNELLAFVSSNRKHLIYLEIGFLACFLLLILLRTYTPNIEGTEKPLEFVVINSILRADFFPPEDVWLAGKTINYYYLGQFIFCNILKLGFIDPSIGFNLITPTVMAFILIGSFEFILELTRSVWWGLLAAFMTGLMGNLEPYEQISRMGWSPDTFRWWDAGHIIPFSFPEFPYWSFLHSDVHAHFLVHPFTILFLFLILSFVLSGNYLITLEDFKNSRKFAVNILYCIILGSFMLINTWNYPSAIALTFAGLFIHCYINLPRTNVIVNILRVFPAGLFYILTSYIIYLAFYAYFESPVKGIGFVDATHKTTSTQLLLLIGTFLFPIVIIILSDIINKVILNKKLGIKTRIILIVIILIIPCVAFLITKGVVIPFILTIWLYLLISLLSRKLNPESSIIYAIAFLVYSLILCCEFIYVNDMFSGDYERQNTVAKSYIQLLLLLPLATAYIMYLISSQNLLKGLIKRSYIVTITLLIILSSGYLYFGTYVKNNKFTRNYKDYNWNIPTLKGSDYIRTCYDGEYDGIMWLRKNAKRTDIVLEVEGAPYSHYGRVASHSGVPTLINWTGSLNVLRGEFFYLVSYPRSDAIEKIFGNPDKRAVHTDAKINNVSYIFVGPLERNKYSEEQLEGFKLEKDLYQQVFKKGNTAIYKVI